MEKDLDIKLYNEYLDGEKSAFEFLYNKYKDKIQYFVYNIVKDYQKAEDITQDVFIYVMQNKIKEGYTFKYYLYLVAKSRAYNLINMKKRRIEINEDYYNSTEQVGQDVADIVTKNEKRKAIMSAIDMLDDRYKNAIYLVKIEELTYQETAQILGESVQNVKNLIHRGKKELRKILIKKGFDEINKVSKVIILVLCISVLLAGGVYATVKIYETIKSYYLEDDVKEPITNSEAPVGEVVFKQFNIKDNEPKVNIENWQKNNKLYYKKVTEYAEYKELMDKYQNLRKLDEKDFENYFAVVILNENIDKLLNYKFITYSDEGEDKILHINIDYKDNMEEQNLQYSGLLVIMTNWHKDFIIKPELK